MNIFLLYLLLLKATCTSFSGLASLPMLRTDLVARHHVMTDAQLNTAVTAGRTGPGPIGIYVVCVGYQVRGTPGAIAGLVATITPAFLIIALLKWLGRVADRPGVQRTIRSVLIASAGLLAGTTANLVGSGIGDAFTAAVAGLSFAALAFTRVDSMWVMIAAAVLGVGRKLLVS